MVEKSKGSEHKELAEKKEWFRSSDDVRKGS